MERGLLVAIVIASLIILIAGILLYYPLLENRQHLSIPKPVTVRSVNIYWLGYVRDFNSSSSENFSLNAGQSFNYSVGFDGESYSYKIESVYTNTSGFAVVGTLAEGYNESPNTPIPYPVFGGTNFPFIILVKVSASSFNGTVNLFVVSSSD